MGAFRWCRGAVAAGALLPVIVVFCSCTSGSYEGYKNRPYSIRGVRYYPMGLDEALEFHQEGIASWYDEGGFLGFGRGSTAIGEPYRARAKAGAHKTLPLPCRVKVTNLANGRSVEIRVNDRGPFVGERILDVTIGVASKLGFKSQGLARVRIEVLSVGDGHYRVKPGRRSRTGRYAAR